MTRRKKHRNKSARPPAITKERAQAFFAYLDEAEQHMGEGAALAVTLEAFGYENWRNDVLADMAEASGDFVESVDGFQAGDGDHLHGEV